MNSFTPRTVEGPALRRWTAEAYRLIMRAPTRFGALAGSVVLADYLAATFAPANLTYNQVLPLAPFFCVPVLAFVTMLARAADIGPAARTGQQLLNGTMWRVLMVMAAAASGFIFSQTIFWNLVQTLPSLAQVPVPFVHGSLVTAFRTAYMTTALVCTPIIVPLAMYASASPAEAYGLGTIGVKVNLRPMLGLLCVIVFGGIISTHLISYGVIASVFLVGQSVLNYVAYRDIYERRSESAAATVRAQNRIVVQAAA